MTRSSSSIYPAIHPPGSRVLVRPSEPRSLSKVDNILVALSSLCFVGSVFWVPLVYAWAVKKWREVPKHEKRRRAIYMTFLLSAAALAVKGPHRKKRVGKWLNVRSWILWKAWMNFIAFEVVSDPGLAAVEAHEVGERKKFDVRKDQAILAVIPHGIFPFALAFSALPEAAAQAFGEFRPVVATATVLFPFVRTFLGWLGAVDASRPAVDKALASGSRIGLAPGGIAEMFEGYPKPLTHKDDEFAILGTRKGFIRMAIKHGVPVVPIYCFGATKMFKRLQLPAFVETVSKLLRISICIFFGRWGLPIPFRTRLLYVMGKPLFPPTAERDEDMFRRQVDDMHARFCDELVRLFNNHKTSYGWDQKTLRLV